MCGLVGSYLVPLEPGALDMIRHRGPDGSGIWSDGVRSLGHTRLAIRDLRSVADQPFGEQHIVLTYNGELWNDAELRQRYGGSWLTTGDTEVVARAIATKGLAGLADLDGMWAVAWYDRNTDRTWLARDTAGRIPLYRCVARSLFDEGIYWSSERKALPWGEPSIAVPPGHAYCVETGETVRYSRPLPAMPPACPEQVLALLRQGVQERLLSDVPVCYLISGGLDSSFILSLARQLLPNQELHAYTAVFDPDSDDLRHARMLCTELDVTLHEVKVHAPGMKEIADAIDCIEIPYKAQVEIALAHLPLSAAIQSDGFKVCLSGEAADELFGGYGNTQIKAGKLDDNAYRQHKLQLLSKMGRGNFIRVNKVMMRHGIEARLPFMQRDLVHLAINASKHDSPPGKKLLKEAARGLVPDRIIRRPKDTFQGGTGMDKAANAITATPTLTYNDLARTRFGYLPKD